MKSTEQPPLLSIILPVHNEEYRLPETMQQVSDFLAAQPYSGEVLIVENGSDDKSFEIAQELLPVSCEFLRIS